MTPFRPLDSVEINNQRQPVPVDDEMLKKIAELSGGQAFNASSLVELKNVYASLQQQIGYETIRGDASAGWLRLGALMLAASALAAMLINAGCPPERHFWVSDDEGRCAHREYATDIRLPRRS